MNTSSLNQLFHRQYTYKQRIEKIILSLIILLIGGLIYVGCREKSLLMFHWFSILGINDIVNAFRDTIHSEGIYGWVKYSLPDGLWLFSYMFIVDAIWNGSKDIASYVYIYSLPTFALLSEFLLYFGLFSGVFDWVDVASYVLAIFLFICIKLIK